MFSKKNFAKPSDILHREYTPLNEGDLNKLSVANGDLRLTGLWKFEAPKLKSASDNLIILDGANIMAPNLKTVSGNILVRDAFELNLPMLESAYCVYINNVPFVSLPKLKNCKIYIDNTRPCDITVDPSTNVIYGRYPLEQKTIDAMLENYAAACRSRFGNVR